jgi:hypothetical protein
MQEANFLADSLLEQTRFEPSVSPEEVVIIDVPSGAKLRADR